MTVSRWEQTARVDLIRASLIDVRLVRTRRYRPGVHRKSSKLFQPMRDYHTGKSFTLRNRRMIETAKKLHKNRSGQHVGRNSEAQMCQVAIWVLWVRANSCYLCVLCYFAYTPQTEHNSLRNTIASSDSYLSLLHYLVASL
jgi:hypothetical protein